MSRLRAKVVIVFVLVSVGCGGASGPPVPPEDDVAAEWTAGDDAQLPESGADAAASGAEDVTAGDEPGSS